MAASSVSLYCSPTQLLLLVGSVSGQQATVDEFKAIPLPEQSMINGVITNKDVMTRFLQDVSQRFGPWNQDAVLVLEGNNIRTKIMTLPTMKESKLLPFVQRDFGELGGGSGAGAGGAGADSDDVFDFAILGTNHVEGGLDVLGIAAGRLLLQNYIDVFTAGGFKLKRIDVGSNALAKVASFIPPLQSDSSILVHVDEMALVITLFEQGVYRITQRYRLLNPPQTEERNREVISNISSMVQFQRSQRRDISINAIYILGVAAEQLPAFIEATRFLELPVFGLSLDSQIRLTGKANFEQANFVSSKYLYNLGAMIRR
jgi:Tfp pilus assembly PilM family ATPase